MHISYRYEFYERCYDYYCYPYSLYISLLALLQIFVALYLRQTTKNVLALVGATCAFSHSIIMPHVSPNIRFPRFRQVCGFPEAAICLQVRCLVSFMRPQTQLPPSLSLCSVATKTTTAITGSSPRSASFPKAVSSSSSIGFYFHPVYADHTGLVFFVASLIRVAYPLSPLVLLSQEWLGLIRSSVSSASVLQRWQTLSLILTPNFLLRTNVGAVPFLPVHSVRSGAILENFSLGHLVLTAHARHYQHWVRPIAS